jgi:hypothetical protein
MHLADIFAASLCIPISEPNVQMLIWCPTPPDAAWVPRKPRRSASNREKRWREFWDLKHWKSLGIHVYEL